MICYMILFSGLGSIDPAEGKHIDGGGGGGGVQKGIYLDLL